MKKNTVRILALVLVALMCLSLIPLAAHAEGHVHFYEPTTIAPTCAQNGYVQMICEACGDGGEILSWIPPTGEHSFIPVEDEEYLIEEGDCTHPYQYWKSCSVCKQSAEEAYGLAIDKLVEELNARKQSGEQADWETVAKDRVLLLDERYKFSAGGEGHHIVHVDHQEATCTSDGWKDYTYCDVCNEYFNYEAIPAKGHRWTEFKVTKAATCTEPGSQERVCEVCDEKEVQVIPALGHKGEFVVTKDFTCTEPGSKERICTVCHEKEIVAIPAAHRWGEFVVTQEPTCYSTGAKQHTCTVCGETAVEWIDMAHKYENGVCVFCGAAQPADEKSVSESAAFKTEEPVEEPVEEIAALDNIIYISFDGNGATSGSMEAQAFEPGTTQNLSPNAFERTGYRFVGWDTMADGTGMGDEPYFADGEQVTLNADITLYAQWAEDPEVAAENAVEETTEFEANGLTIKFNGNGETSGTMENLEIPSSDDGGVNLTPNAFTRTLYAFTGWNTQADGSGKYFEDKQFVSANDFTSFDTPSVTLYAQWVRIQVQFDSNGGSGSMENQFINETPEKLTKNTFTRGNNTYTFTGWDTDPEGHGQHFSDEQYVSTADIPAPIVLYAQWKRNILVTYQSNVDSGSGKKSYAEPIKYPGDTLTIKTLDETGIPTKANRYFIEWNTARDGSGTPYKPGETMYITEETSARPMLYAQWGFDVSFDANGGVGNMEPLKAIENKELDLSEDAINQFTRDEYYFAGWNTLKDGTGKSYEDGATIPASDMTDPFTLYAQWKSNKVTVSFNANNGTGTMEPQEGKVGEALQLNANTFTREGFMFTAWNTEADGSGKAYANGALIPAADVTDSFVLYAQWKKAVTITFDANDGIGTMDPQQGEFGVALTLNENVYTRENYIFKEWNTMADGTGKAYADEETIPASEMTEDITLYAQWKSTTVTVSFDANEGTGTMEPKEGKIGEALGLPANTFTRKGYDFTGWNTDKDGKGKAYADKTTIPAADMTDDITLYAQWEKTLFKVTFHPNGGSGKMEPQEFKKGEKKALDKNETSEGVFQITKVKSAFAGWNTKKDGTGTDYEDGEEITVTKDITLYAQWDYAIVFYPNGGTGSMDRQSINEEDLGKTVLLNANTFTRTNYSFDHWNTEPDGSGDSYANQGEITPTGSVKLYAQWIKTSFSVNYERNGGGGAKMTPNTISKGATGTVKENTYNAPDSTKIFSGWQTADGEIFQPGDSIESDDVPSDITLYAIWRDKLTVWFYPGAGDGTAGPREVPKGGEVKMPSASSLGYTAPAGQTFAGWQIEGEDRLYRSGETYVFNTEKKVVAQWGDTITITYDPNGATASSRKLQRVAKNNPIKLASMEQIGYTYPGFAFKGWALTASAKEERWEDAATIEEGFSADTVLYAVWEQHIFTGVVTISGSQSIGEDIGYVGETLTATVTGEKVFTNFSYQWMRDGVAIDGATAETYAPTSADFNCIITCDVTANDAIEGKTKTSINHKYIYIDTSDKNIVNNGQAETDYVYGVYQGMYYSVNNGAKQPVTLTNGGVFPVTQQGIYRFFTDASSNTPVAVVTVYNWWTVGYSLSTGSGSDSSGSGSVTFKRGSTTLSSSTTIRDSAGNIILQPYTLSGYTNVWVVRADAGITDITMNVKPSSGSYGHVALNNGSYDSSSSERTISLGTITQPMLYQVVFNKSSSSPRTADMSHLGLWSALCLTSFVGAATILGSARKRKKDQA